MKASDFATRDKANEGKQVNIPGPDGKITAEWFVIHPGDCDQFRKVRAEVRSTRGLEIAALKDDAAIEKAKKRMGVELVAACVSAWSLEDEFSHAACADLLEDAPYLEDFVERIADNRSLFFGKGSASLSTTQKGKAGSKPTQKTAKETPAKSS